MGVMTFTLPEELPPGGRLAVDFARFAGGYDHSPFPTSIQVVDHQLILARAQNESGYVLVPWPIGDLGFPVTTTATLRERTEPYRLLVELARGKINQVRTYAAEWELLGLQLDDETQSALTAAVKAFAGAVQAETPGESDPLATEALSLAYQAAGRAVQLYAGTCINIRKQSEAGLSTRWGARLCRRPEGETEKYYRSAFNTVRLTPNWSTIEPQESQYDWSELDAMVEWALQAGLNPSIGPLIDLTSDTLPEWLANWHGELPSIAAFFCDFLETAIHRYRDRISTWLLCSGFNHANSMGLTEDDRLRLTARLLEAARNADPDSEFLIGLSQPWGDYLERDDYTYSPLVFADTLMRSGLPVNGFEVEIVAGDESHASQLRDGLDTLRLLELFGILGLPIELMFRHPGRPAQVTGNSTLPEIARPSSCWRGSDSLPAQAEWGGTLAAVALSLPHIRSVHWGQWIDTPDLHSGLLTHESAPKPMLAILHKIRSQFIE